MNKTIIMDELYKIAREQDMTILYASEVGSRVYGFASKNSSFDVRFIFMRKESYYLRIQRNLKDDIDTFTTISGINIDMHGWEITKFLTQLHKGSYSAIEWLKSPCVYIEDKQFKKLLGNINSYFIPYRAAIAYRNLAKDMKKEIDKEDIVPIKNYLHAINFILDARMCSINKVPPVLSMSMKLHLVKNDEVLKIILCLIDERTKNNTTDIIHVSELDSYIGTSLDHLDAVLQRWDSKRDSLINSELLNFIFYKLIKDD